VSSTTEARPLVQGRLLVRAVPAWAWVSALVVVSAAIRFQLARGVAAPWIMVDELIYSELAKSIASGGHFLVRDQPTGAYGFVYPLLISPAYALFHAVPDAYTAAKAINAVVMSLAAVPAYLLARRVLSVRWALGATLIALALPGFVYTGTLMTENAFYPVFLGCVLVLVLVLERPTALRQVGLLALCALAFLVRTQAVALVPAVLLAPPLLDRIDRRPWRDLARYRVLYLVTLGGAVLAVGVQLARGRSLGELLGAYRAATESSYSIGGVARWIVYHFAGLDLATGVVPFAALLLLLVLVRRLDRPARAFAVAAASVSFWLVVEVGAFASGNTFPQRIEERNLFFLVPLFAIALLVWIERGAARPPARTIGAGVVSAGLVAAIPFTSLIGPSAVSDTFSLLPWWWLGDHVVDGSRLRLVAGLIAAVAVALLALPRRALLVLPLLLVAYFSVSTAVVLDGVHGVRDASVGSLWAGIKRAPANWVDGAVGPDADVAAIWTGKVSAYTIWENEFFSRSVGPVYDLQGPLPGGLPETPISVDRSDGSVRLPNDGALDARYVLVDGSFTPDGRVVARDPRQGVALYETGGVVRTSTFVDGLYPDDTWSGRTVTYRRLRCDGGSLGVTLASDPNLFRAPQQVIARAGGDVVARTELSPRGRQTLRVPLRPGADGVCRVTFAVSPTAVPAKVDPSSDDRRVLGAHFLGFAYRPSG
jgi:hypothetical protein